VYVTVDFVTVTYKASTPTAEVEHLFIFVFAVTTGDGDTIVVTEMFFAADWTRIAQQIADLTSCCHHPLRERFGGVVDELAGFIQHLHQFILLRGAQTVRVQEDGGNSLLCALFEHLLDGPVVAVFATMESVDSVIAHRQRRHIVEKALLANQCSPDIALAHEPLALRPFL